MPNLFKHRWFKTGVVLFCALLVTFIWLVPLKTEDGYAPDYLSKTCRKDGQPTTTKFHVLKGEFRAFLQAQTDLQPHYDLVNDYCYADRLQLYL